MQVQQNPVSQTNPAEIGTSQPTATLQKPSLPLSDIQLAVNSVAQSLQQAVSQTGNQPTSGLSQSISSLISFVTSTLNDLMQLLQQLLNPPPTVVEPLPSPQTPPTTPGAEPGNPPGNSTSTPNNPGAGDGGSGNGSGSGVGGGSGSSGSDTPIDTGTPGVDQPVNAPKVSLIPGHAREFDRTGEIEWRPRLNDGKLQVIFRPEHADLAEKVEIYSPDGTTLLATGTKAGKTADGRPIYNFDRAGGDFPDNAVVVMTFKGDKGVRKMTIADTSEKYVHGTPAAGSSGGSNSGASGSGGGSSVGAGSGAGSSSGTGSSSGAGTPKPASQIPAHATEFEATGTIEWRPRLNNNKLSIIFRKAHLDIAESVKIYSADGTQLLATGTYGGKTSDGRPIYNFDKAGGEFPANAVVVMNFKNTGGARRMTIPTPADKVVR